MLEVLNLLVTKDPLNKLDKFVVNDSNKAMLTDVKNYLARVEGTLDLNKGILFLGDKGIGKTLMIDCLKACMDQLWRKVLTVYTSPYISKNYYAKPIVDNAYPLSFQLHYYRYLAINDIGFERDYANGSSIIQEILFDRFEKRLITFGTTNLSEVEFCQRYDDDKNRMADRYPLMFNYITLTGESFR